MAGQVVDLSKPLPDQSGGGARLQAGQVAVLLACALPAFKHLQYPSSLPCILLGRGHCRWRARAIGMQPTTTCRAQG